MKVDPTQILVHALGFFILFMILKKFAWGQLLTAMEARSQRIADDLSNIESTKQELAELKTEYEASLAKIEDEARAKINEAVAEGRKTASQIEDEARAQAQQTLEKAKENVAQEIAKARVELKQDVVSLAVVATEKVLRQNLDDAMDKKMREAFVQELNQLESVSS